MIGYDSFFKIPTQLNKNLSAKPMFISQKFLEIRWLMNSSWVIVSVMWLLAKNLSTEIAETFSIIFEFVKQLSR